MSLSKGYKYMKIFNTSGNSEAELEDGDIDMEGISNEKASYSLIPHLQWKLARPLTIMTIVVSLVVIAASTVAAATIQSGHLTIDWHTSPFPARQKLQFNHCGTTPEEARARGCRFELHNFAWVPPQCYDEELGAEWDSHLDWGFSRTANDSTDTDVNFVAECRAGNVREAWVPWHQHMTHCSYILKKYLRSVMFYRPMDNWTFNWNHAEHCTNMMPRYDVEPFFYNSLLHLKFPTCDYSWIDTRPGSEHEVMSTWNDGHGHH